MCTFNETGDRFEPFSMKQEMRHGILTKDGVYKLKRERDEDCDLGQDDEQYVDDEDAWLKSIKQDQIKRAANDGKKGIVGEGSDEEGSSSSSSKPAVLTLSEQLQHEKTKSKLISLLIMVMTSCSPLFKLTDEEFVGKISVSKVINKLKVPVKPKQKKLNVRKNTQNAEEM